MMALTDRLTELEGFIRTADERLTALRNQIEQTAKERLLLEGAMLEVRRLLAPEPQANVAAEEIAIVSPGGTD